MEKTFILKGLDCPNCAAKIEAEILKLEEITEASVNLMNQTLKLKHHPSVNGDEIFKKIEKLVHTHEPDVEVIHKHAAHEHEHEHDHGHSHGAENDSPWRLRRLVIGGIFAIASFAFYYLLPAYQGWMLPAFIATWLILGYDVLINALKNLFRGRMLDENFLMTVASAGAFGIQEYPEAVAVILLYQLGEYFQDRAVANSRRSIASLLEIRPDVARVFRNGEYVEVAPSEVSVGEKILVRPGERIPMDAKVVEGASKLDMRAITGESLPKSVKQEDDVFSGSVNLETALTLEVTKLFDDSTASKIVELVENAASKKAPAENFITKFARIYTPIVVGLAALLALIPPLFFDGLWADWLQRAFVFLVISCPCALVISVPLSYFSGIGAASRQNILVRGSTCFETLREVRNFVFDKTGTLTKGSFEITHIEPAKGVAESDLLEAAACAETQSNHPIARSIKKAASSSEIPDEYQEISGQGVRVKLGECTILAGNQALMNAENIDFKPSEQVGTVIYVARNQKYLGAITISDEIRPETPQMLENLRKHEITKLIMLTGDAPRIAENTSKQLNLDEYHANLMPADKLTHFEEIAKTGKTAFVGDGINDAPVLARADVGIAMGALGADAAIEAADVVLMSDDISLIPKAIHIAKRTHRIVIQNIVFAIAVKIILLVLGALGLIGLWAAVFGDVGVMIIAVLNAVKMLRKA